MIQQYHSLVYIQKKKQKTKKNTNSERYMYPSVQSSTIYNSQDMEAT